MDRRHAIGVIGIVIFMGGYARAQSTPAATPVPTPSDIHAAGDWSSDVDVPRPTRRWNLDVARGADNSIRGRVSVSDSPLLAAGNVEGRIDGTNVAGTISDDDGNQIATFTGTVGASGMSGSYTDSTGETGGWAWDGPLPQ